MRPRVKVFMAAMAVATAAIVWVGRAQELGDASAQGSVKAYRPPVPGVHALVTSANPLSSMAGVRVLMAGGNAFDAAVAIAATLNVVEPQSSGIAGNGFTTLFDKKTGKVHSLSMAGATPKALKAEAMTPQTLNAGINASVVPGNIGGLIVMLDRFGTKSLADVLAPAIEYAEKGHPINASLAGAIAGSAALKRNPTSAKFFMPNGKPPVEGEMFKQPDLAATFRKLAEAEQTALKQGKTRAQALTAAFDRFYKGDIAQEVVRFHKEHNGYLAAEDLAAYQPRWDEPVHTTYRGYDIYSNPSSSRGGLEVVMQLNLIEGFDLKAMGQNSPAALHLIAESIKVAKADIYHYVGDPKFTTIPLSTLVSKDYAAQRRKLIDPAKANAYPNPGDLGPATRVAGMAAAGPVFPEIYPEDYDTTSFSVVDQTGNAVSCTPTVGGGFGTGVIMGNTGLIFNNGLRLGSTAPYPDNVNYVRPGQIPLLNNSPIIVMKDGKLVMAIGTPGGETIGQTEFQGLLNVLDFGMNIQEAIEAPRMRLDPKPNFYKPGAEMTFAIENRIPPATVKALQAMGHTVQLLPAFTAGVGGMQGILVDLATGTMTGGADPRRAGYAIGW